jgi:hypothetical protein
MTGCRRDKASWKAVGVLEIAMEIENCSGVSKQRFCDVVVRGE